MQKKIYYFDHAATTPIRREVLAAMNPYFSKEFGNPSNLYELSRRAKSAIVEATKKIADTLGCQTEEFVFTGSATEANNITIQGIAKANREKGNKIIISNVEHKSVLATCQALKKEGFEIQELGVGTDGLLRPRDLEAALDEKTILVSIIYADSETGSTQPIKEFSSIIKKFKETHGKATPYFHTDATQAMAYLDTDVNELGVDLMTLSAHKIYGPKGVGGLFVRKGVEIAPLIFGGGQRGKLRAGTENVSGIAGLGEAIRIIKSEKETKSKQIKFLRDKLEKGIFESIPKVVLNGHPIKRLPNFLNVSILDIEGEALLLHLDEKGIYVSTGSACNSESLEPSYILTALGRPYEFIHGSIRFTLGKDTKTADVEYLLRELPKIVKTLRQISPLNLDLNQKTETSQPKAFIGGQTPHFLRKKK